jgi:hypothetical protein
MPAKPSQSRQTIASTGVDTTSPIPGVEVEPGEDPFVHASFDWIASAAVRSGSQIHNRRSERKPEPIAKGNVCRMLQHLPNDLILVLTGRDGDTLNRKVDVHRGSSRLVSQLQRIASLQEPGRRCVLEQPCEQSVE